MIDDESDEGPPSAPRLREIPQEDVPTDEHDLTEEEEPQLKTPPPESGRQHVTPGPSAAVAEPDEDISITVTMEESEAPPPITPESAAIPPLPVASARTDISDMTPPPRLALVSEPEIELHGMTPLSAIAEPVAPERAAPAPLREPSDRPAASAPLRPQDVELAVAVPSSVPGTAAEQRGPEQGLMRTTPPVDDTRPSVIAAPASAPPVSELAPAAPPVRLMTRPPTGDAGPPGPPVEVWASTHAPTALAGQVANFVGQNARFEPKTFTELVRASAALGEDDS